MRWNALAGLPEDDSPEGWPISYEDLARFYEKVEEEIGMSGDDAGDPFHASQIARSTPITEHCFDLFESSTDNKS
ncbi:MAG: hypothetical protein ABSD59_14890 [Terracidiphilus sp.]|jgi:choline dehydrogenase-like flavoprotein